MLQKYFGEVRPAAMMIQRGARRSAHEDRDRSHGSEKPLGLTLHRATPLGAIEPPDPAEAVIVHDGASPTAKSLNEVTPVAWVLVAVRVPVPVVFQVAPS